MPSDRIIACIDHGVYGVSPEACPLCPVCDQPMWKGERITLQTVDTGPHSRELLRLVHSQCSSYYDEDSDDD